MFYLKNSPCVLELHIEIFTPEMIGCQDLLLNNTRGQKGAEGIDDTRLTLN